MRSMRPAIERVMPRAPLQRVVAPLAIAIERGPSRHRRQDKPVVLDHT
jgi:hypothetical protein